ncbi:C40 family peptidase [Virgibacillus natechei]|uniref:C40 family peptidase n=1 Tax=Virgibacillus sp. CBA3643 TaxID=2942278 RepID=UPI0035A2FCCB
MKKTIVAVTTVVTVGIGSALFGVSAHAEPLDKLENQQSQIESDREDLKANLSEAEAEIADVLFDLEALNEDIELVDDALEHNQGKMDEAEANIAEKEEKVDSLEEEISNLEDKIEKRYEILKDRLVSYQQNGGDINYLEVVFGSKSFGDFINRISAVNKITDSDAALVEQQENDKQEVEEKQDEVLDKLDELKDQKSELDEMIVLIEDQKEQNEESKDTLLTKQNDLETLKDDLEMEDSQLAALEDEVSANIAEENQPEPSTTQNVDVASDSADEETDANVTTVSNEESTSNNTGSDNNDSIDTNSSNNNNDSSNNDSNNDSGNDQPKQTSSSSGSGMSAVINAGFDHLGLPYVWGGKTPSGFDCSGFVSWAFAQGGYSIPSTTGALAGIGSSVSYSNAQPGDMVFFDTGGSNSHVGIYLGGGQFIGAQNSTGLAVADMNSGYWKDAFNGHVRRVN